MKIRGNTVGTPMKRPDFNQTDERKSDYIKNNPIPVINEGDEGKIPMAKDGAYVLEKKAEIFKEFTEQTTAAIEVLDNKKADTYKRVVVDTFTTTEEAIINKDYSSYNAKGMYVKMVVPAGTVANNRGLTCYFTTGSTGNTWCGYGTLRITDGSATYTGRIRCFDEYGEWVTEFYDGSQTLKHGASSEGVDNTKPNNLYIKKFCTQNTVPSGVTVTVTLLLPLDYKEAQNENT